MERVRQSTKKLVVLAMMLAMIVVLAFFEHMLPPLPLLPVNMRLGLSNVVTMYALFFLGKKPAFLLAGLKSGFVFLTRGFAASVLSASGGMLSIIAVVLLAAIFGSKISYLLLSVAGAVFHNTGQLIAASFLMSSNFLAVTAPILLASGIVLGSLTGVLLKTVMPLFHNLVGKDYGN